MKQYGKDKAMAQIKKRIMIVDDEADFVRSSSYRLTFEGYEIVEAQSAEEALKKLDDARPDLILLDVMMPGMTGVQFHEILRKKKGFENVPVVFLTVWDQMVSSDQKALTGNSRLITKPFNFEELLRTIKEMLSL